MQYVAITGHRPAKLDYDYELTSALTCAIKDRIWQFIVSNTRPTDVTFITGMALGIDTLFAKMAIELNIPFIAAIPCIGHSLKWPSRSVDVYNQITHHPLCTIKLISETTYSPTVMQKRNEWMVDNCNELIAVWDGTPGGTKNCLDYAKKKLAEIGDRPIKGIYLIDPNEIRKQIQTKPFNS